MAWVEEHGPGWRVRFREGNRVRAIGEFWSYEEAVTYASDPDNGEHPSVADPVDEELVLVTPAQRQQGQERLTVEGWRQPVWSKPQGC
jgi:hypothetical protein